MRRLPYRAAQRGLVCRLEQEQPAIAVEPLQGWHDDPCAGDLGELLHALGRGHRSRAGALLHGQAPGGQRRRNPYVLDREHSLHLCRSLHGPAGAALESARIQGHRLWSRAGGRRTFAGHAWNNSCTVSQVPLGRRIVNAPISFYLVRKRSATALIMIALSLALAASAE